MANSVGYHESESKLRPETLDNHRAFTSMQEELEATDWYDQRVDAATDTELKEILAHNRDEEKEHFARLVVWHRSYLLVDSVGFAIAGEELLRGEASPCLLVFSLCRLIQQNDHPYHLVRWREFCQSLREFESPPQVLLYTGTHTLSCCTPDAPDHLANACQPY